MNVYAIINLAEQNADRNMASSAKSCLRDAWALIEAENEVAAKERALKSLAYSVGVYSATYKAAAS